MGASPSVPDAAALVDARLADAARYVPFVPERTEGLEERGDAGLSRLKVWTVVPEAARGGYLAGASGEGWLVYDGQVAEAGDAPLDRSVAQLLLARGEALDATSRSTDGDWVILRRDGEGVEAATDFLGACHLYYGERGGLVVISNRALVAAAALHGHLPGPDPRELAWLHTAFSAPLALRTPWAGLKMLGPNAILRARGGRAWTTPKTPDRDGELMSFDEAFAELVERTRAVARFPGLSFRFTLTGGKDSRAVLGALVAADVLDHVEGCYLEGDPELADAKVGRALAAHYGLRFEMDPVPFSNNGDLFSCLAIHNFQAELVLNAWDLKGVRRKRRSGDLRGYYGEIYKDHDIRVLQLGWPLVRAAYGSAPFIDPHRILTRSARGYLREHLGAWIDQLVAEGEAPIGVHHRLHREVRMARWCGQAQRSDAMGSLAINPLASRRLFHRYFALTRTDRRHARIHYELIRRTDDWLAAQPFADYQWKPDISPNAPPAVGGKGGSFQKSLQLALWRDQGRAVEAFLLAETGPGASDFFEVYSRRGLTRLVGRMARKPTHRKLKAIMAAAAIRLALSRGIEPRPFVVDPA